jgi:hypothetical protein
MKSRGFRTLIFAGGLLLAVWAIALGIFYFSGRSKMTVDKVRHYVDSTDLSQLSAGQRDKAISDFANMVNSLSAEDRMKWRRDDDWKKWFASLTDDEKRKFIEKTLPTGFKQMLASFSQLPPDQRKKIIDDAVSNLKQAGAAGVDRSAGDYGKNGPPPLSPELEQQVRQIGLTEFYTDSSPETKAELAPLMEQIQLQLRNGQTR